jgi:single-strand DNA-binding protein
MASYNKVLLMGNLTRDPEVRATSSGQSVTALGLACNRTYYVGGQGGQGGEKREEVTFIDVDFWGKRGEVIAQYFKKGDPIFIEGRLTFRQWDDKEGHKRSKLSVTAESFEFVGGGRRGEGGAPGPGRGAAPREAQGEAQGEAAPQAGGEMEAGFDEVPF